MITADVVLRDKTSLEDGHTHLQFFHDTDADPQDWAPEASPRLALTLVVTDDVAERLSTATAYTLQLTAVEQAQPVEADEADEKDQPAEKAEPSRPAGKSGNRQR